MPLDTPTPTDIDPNSGSGSRTRIRSMSSDSALVDHYLHPSRGVSLDLNGGGGYYAQGGYPHGAVSPAPMNGVGDGGENGWQGGM